MKKWGVGLVILLILAGCGGPKADVSVFIMPEKGIFADNTKLEQSLKAKLGQSPTVQVNVTPIFNPQKLIVEMAAGGHSIMIFPIDQLAHFLPRGAAVPLDDVFAANAYPQGVFDVPVDPKNPDTTGKHLYAIPVSKTAWFKEAGYQGDEMLAFIFPKAPDKEKAIAVLKAMVEAR